MNRLFELSCRTDSHVLILGPTGSGKSTLAKKIHDSSLRSARPFVSVNLATAHEGTLESELFGHEKGAFTGADQKRMGRLESAQGGTVFLDEIGELTPKLQARLLDFLQTRTIYPLGGNRAVTLDVRVICATHRDLDRLVQTGEFREDLLHRIRVIEITLAGLRDIAGTLDRAIHDQLEELMRLTGRKIARISPEVAEIFENYAWPGHFRELRNVLEYAVIASDSDELKLSDLPQWFMRKVCENAIAPPVVLSAAQTDPDHYGMLNYRQAMREFEQAYLKKALHRYRGRVNLTSRRIGLPKSSLMRRMSELSLSHWAAQQRAHEPIVAHPGDPL